MRPADPPFPETRACRTATGQEPGGVTIQFDEFPAAAPEDVRRQAQGY
jgi:hypothetical protein